MVHKGPKGTSTELSLLGGSGPSSFGREGLPAVCELAHL